MRSLQDKHVLITGGGAGIGLCIAKQCVQQGARVTLLDVSDCTAELLQIRTLDSSCQVEAVKADVSDFAQVVTFGAAGPLCHVAM